MMQHNRTRRFRSLAGAAALLFLLSNCGPAQDEAAFGPAGTPPVPATASSPASPEASGESRPQSAAPAANGPALKASKPVNLAIPALDRQSEVIETGLRDDRTLEVPPVNEGAPASWFNGSSAPGEAGPAVLLGHVNSAADESGVFYQLGTLKPGDVVSVLREDGLTANFEVYRTESYPKNDFPTQAVYFPTKHPELRLITCDGFTAASGLFEDNLVVYAKFTGTA